MILPQVHLRNGLFSTEKHCLVYRSQVDRYIYMTSPFSMSSVVFSDSVYFIPLVSQGARLYLKQLPRKKETTHSHLVCGRSPYGLSLIEIHLGASLRITHALCRSRTIRKPSITIPRVITTGPQRRFPSRVGAVGFRASPSIRECCRREKIPRVDLQRH